MTAISGGGPYVCVDKYKQVIQILNDISSYVSINGPLSQEKFLEIVERHAPNDKT